MGEREAFTVEATGGTLGGWVVGDGAPGPAASRRPRAELRVPRRARRRARHGLSDRGVPAARARTLDVGGAVHDLPGDRRRDRRARRAGVAAGGARRPFVGRPSGAPDGGSASRPPARRAGGGSDRRRRRWRNGGVRGRDGRADSQGRARPRSGARRARNGRRGHHRGRRSKGWRSCGPRTSPIRTTRRRCHRSGCRSRPTPA